MRACVRLHNTVMGERLCVCVCERVHSCVFVCPFDQDVLNRSAAGLFSEPE